MKRVLDIDHLSHTTTTRTQSKRKYLVHTQERLISEEKKMGMVESSGVRHTDTAWRIVKYGIAAKYYICTLRTNSDSSFLFIKSIDQILGRSTFSFNTEPIDQVMHAQRAPVDYSDVSAETTS
jgi:hypothetical protein